MEHHKFIRLLIVNAMKLSLFEIILVNITHHHIEWCERLGLGSKLTPWSSACLICAHHFCSKLAIQLHFKSASNDFQDWLKNIAFRYLATKFSWRKTVCSLNRHQNHFKAKHFLSDFFSRDTFVLKVMYWRDLKNWIFLRLESEVTKTSLSPLTTQLTTTIQN